MTQQKNTTEVVKLYREANQQVKKKKQRRHGLKRNTKASKKTCRKKQQQESIPACERTDELETSENY